MANGSKKAGKARFGPEAERQLEPVLAKDDLKPHLAAGKVSISLRYFQKSCECFSDWTGQELKKFVSTIEKIRSYNPNQLKSKKNLCEIHKYAPKKARFSRPADLAEDIRFYEIKVDQANKLRIHGPFVGDVFFLVWLDREHGCFPE